VAGFVGQSDTDRNNFNTSPGAVKKIGRREFNCSLSGVLLTKFEFVFKLRAAKILGVTIPAPLLAIADDGIE
jgi:hypothetical protein